MPHVGNEASVYLVRAQRPPPARQSGTVANSQPQGRLRRAAGLHLRPAHFGTTRRGSPKTGSFRAKFLLESVADLRSRLRAVGSDLLVGVGKPEELLPSLIAQREEGAPALTTTILCQEQVTSEELKVDAALRSALPAGVAQFKPVWGGTLYEKSELPFRVDLSDVPDVFTPFRNKVESKCSMRAPLRTPPSGSLPLPTAEALAKLPDGFLSLGSLPPPSAVGLTEADVTMAADPRGVMPFPGGEEAALKRLKHYLWDSDSLSTYFETRNGMLGADYSSKFAPWLAHGCLSPRQVAHECAKYESERVKNKSTYWMVFELIWRDYFKLYCAKHGRSVFMEGGPIGSHQMWRSDPELLQRWKDGRLGVPLVDANMRELAATGFMSNRGRQNVASYLALDLQLDWRHGADHFESLARTTPRLRCLLELGQLGERCGPHRRPRQPLQHRQAEQGLRCRRRVCAPLAARAEGRPDAVNSRAVEDVARRSGEVQLQDWRAQRAGCGLPEPAKVALSVRREGR